VLIALVLLFANCSRHVEMVWTSHLHGKAGNFWESSA